jgi:hypothetical protein
MSGSRPPGQPRRRFAVAAEAGLKDFACGTRAQQRSTRSANTKERKMEKTSNRGTSEQKIASTAKVWRDRDQVAIANKQDVDKQRAEYAARKDLRKVIDEAGVHS